MCGSTKSCCCGCSLKVGSSLLLWSTLVTWVIILLIYLSTAISPTEHISSTYYSPSIERESTQYVSPVSSGNRKYQPGPIILILIPVVISGLGLYGVSKGKSGFVMPYLLYRIIWAIAVTAVLLIPICLLLFGASKTNDIKSYLPVFARPQEINDVGNSLIFALLTAATLLFGVIAMEIHFARVIASHLKSLETMPINYYCDAGMKNNIPLYSAATPTAHDEPMPWTNQPSINA